MSAGALVVQPVRHRAEHRAFCELPYQRYRGDPCWVPPLRREERLRWSARHNPALRSRWACRFLARRDGRVVGRIAAVVDPAFADRWEPGSGFFGFFECADDDGDAAAQLFAAAERALRGRGVSRVLGPVNLTTHDEVGFLVDGFATAPMVLSPYNPAGYASLAERAGYEPFLDYYAYLWSPETEIAPVAARVLRAVVRRGERRVNVRPADPARWDGESRLLYELYNLTFADLWGYVPLSWEEFRARAASFRPFYRPELVLFAECDGRPVGFALTLPNINDALAGVDGRLLPFGWLHLLREVPRIQTGRFLLLGVAPEWRARGVAVALAAAMAAAARRLGMRRVELSLVQAGNRAVQSVIAACGGPRIKTYRLYQKRLA